jgi:hypothetical protein
MSHYGQLSDYVAGFLGVVATLAFAYAWETANIVVGALAAGGMTIAVAIAVYEHFFHKGPTYIIDAHSRVVVEGMSSSRGAHER